MATVAGPELKPRPTEDSVLASFDSIPLFMKSLPEEDGEDATLAALQSLIYEGTPDEVAQNFKEQGNEYFQGKRYREAMGFYTQGIDAKPTDQAILQALLSNRAACNLELKNYGSVLRDCSRVLTINPKSSKGYYRSGQALVALGRVEEALDCCTRCLSYDPDNQGIKALQERATKSREEAERIERKKQDEKRKEEYEKMALKMAFRERNLVIFNKPGGSVNPVSPHFDSEDPTASTLVFPVFFLYPEYATSDIISDFSEDTTFGAHIETMFPPNAPPPAWDKKGEYTAGNLVIYATTYRRRLLKVGKKLSLRDVFKSSKEKEGQAKDGLEIKDGCLSFVVMPKGVVETKWVKEFKKTRDSS
ncbi:unnamed protein product [Cyclocybe aegerita]|uniref:Cns1/TTC4 wheel domain-containing protein n=1 Tax=Cyclocybe aegerita TaxID=1973307 RepID=A0A8S0WKC2_CYCAE|nr:unnamed protein product [Cyclocybe aegerita]